MTPHPCGRGRSAGPILLLLLLLPLALLAGCAARAAPPSADAPQRGWPDIAGRTVMLMPVQGMVPLIRVAAADPERAAVPLGEAARAALDAELAYWLAHRAPRTRWLASEAVDRAVAQSPLIDVRVRELAVRDFQRARLQHIGDPLYGQLRRVAALMDARGAFVPLGAVWVPEQGGSGRVHLSAALIDTLGGDVIWQGVVAGAAGDLDDGNTIASVAQALARLVPQ
jgi:hypothetical protein